MLQWCQILAFLSLSNRKYWKKNNNIKIEPIISKRKLNIAMNLFRRDWNNTSGHIQKGIRYHAPFHDYHRLGPKLSGMGNRMDFLAEGWNHPEPKLWQSRSIARRLWASCSFLPDQKFYNHIHKIHSENLLFFFNLNQVVCA